MEHAFVTRDTDRGSLSAGRLPGRDRTSLLDSSEGMSKRSRRLRFDGRNARPRQARNDGFDMGRRPREAAAIAPVAEVSSSAGRAQGLPVEAHSLARAA